MFSASVEQPAKHRKEDLPAYEQPFKAGIYIHWPFCERKCPYCDFNSHVRATIDQAAWRKALVAEVRILARQYPHLTVGSVFFGGGTPSLMPADTVEAVLTSLDKFFGLSSATEITLEANPSSVEAEHFKGYRAAGVNRLSMGFQSLRDHNLRFLGRLHSADEAKSALKVARSVFESVSFDLIYALPDQTQKAWQEELEEALTFSPDHLSLYQLTIEEGTAFYQKAKRGDLVIPDEDAAADLYMLTDQITHAAGLRAYEVSNYAKPGRESRHNLGYWRGLWYAGLGPGAHGRLPNIDGKNACGIATVQLKRPEDWLAAVKATGWGGADIEVIDRADRAREIVMMGLRLVEGVDLMHLTDTVGLTHTAIFDFDKVDQLARMGLLTWTSDRLTIVGDGRLVINHLAAEILR